MDDKERLEFIKNRIKYKFYKLNGSSGKNSFMNDLIWLIDKAEKAIKKSKK